MSRLPAGGRIDRSRPIRFTVDGRELTGFAGDTVASALLANDIHLVGRSFKYHRPRGILGAGVEEPNALVGVSRGPGRYEPNQRATVVPLTEGLAIETQNRWPSLARDLGAFNDLLSPFIPAGFYYKTFMWPRRAWHALYEPRIRKMAGLGRAPNVADADHYAQRWAHCELLIVGAGPAGFAAALAAAASGARIILCDEGEEPGGALLGDPAAKVDGKPAMDWIAEALATLARDPNVTLVRRTTAFAYGSDNMVALAERCSDHRTMDEATGPRERQWLVRAGRVVIATGAIERPIVFPNNDRPGIMLAAAAASFAGRYAVLPGRTVVACVDHDSGYTAAFALAAAGARVAAIVDSRASPDTALVARARDLGIEVLEGHAPMNSVGRHRVRRIAVAPLGGGASRWIACDLVTMAGGWTPSLHLFSQARGKVVWDEAQQAFLPGETPQAQTSVGACRGSFGLADCLAQGWNAGLGAGGGPGWRGPQAEAEPVGAPARVTASPRREGSRRKAFVDFQNDVTAKDIRLAVREGFQSIEHIKRYTTNGMATDQGRTSNLNALAIASAALDRPLPSVGLTTFRAPYTPTTFGTLAGYARGDLFDPVRTTPTHDWAAANGAVFENVGQWKRARYFAQGHETMEQALRRECIAARASVGMFDASTLGKIEVVGPDAGAFLDLLYVNNLSRMPVGRCRYGIMLREDGFILDDGVIGRLAQDRFHVTTTSGRAANVLHIMEDFRQTEWPELRVWLTSITEQWAVIGVSGPKARDMIAPLVDGIDLSPAALPHMAVREGRIMGLLARLFRVSFTGELGYEINVPASAGQRVWDAVYSAGRPHGITPYGTEAMHVLRAEKGYIIVGQETDGTVTPDDAGLGWAIGRNKPDFVGKRSLERDAMRDPDRRQLVGLLSEDGATVLDEGSQILDPDRPGRSLGHVSSSYFSDALGRPIALAMVRGGRARMDAVIGVATESASVPARIVDPIFYDREGVRLNG